MKLLFDENLSFRLVVILQDLFPCSQHVRECGLRGGSDAEIWEYATANGLMIVTKDSDFQERSVLLGTPPKVVWLRMKNCTTEKLRRFCVPLQASSRALTPMKKKPALSLTGAPPQPSTHCDDRSLDRLIAFYPLYGPDTSCPLSTRAALEFEATGTGGLEEGSAPHVSSTCGAFDFSCVFNSHQTIYFLARGTLLTRAFARPADLCPRRISWMWLSVLVQWRGHVHRALHFL